MEKLQAALGQARQQREGHILSPRQSSPLQRPGDMALEDRWQEIRSFTPDPDQLERHRVVTREASEDASAFDVLRTKLLLQMRQNNWTRLAITSPLSNCGKSTTAVNLALGLGRQKGIRSILFDLDLRNPSVAELLGVEPEFSIGSLFEGEVGFAEHAMRYRSNVAFSMATGMEGDPTRLLLADGTAEALDMVQADYDPDVMIFDLPAVLVNDDTRAFLKNADCALIIARADDTKFSQFDAAEREIAEHTNVLGVVLNACRHAYGSSVYDYSEA